MSVRIGTSGFSYPHWKGVFYPPELRPSSWLGYYQERFDTLELNNTFYRLPKPETFLQWKDAVKKGFLFSIKASRWITHLKRLKNVQEPLDAFLKRAILLGEKLGPVLYQLPPFFEMDIERLEAFLSLLPDGFMHAFEFRHPSWFDERIIRLLREKKVSFCIPDGPFSQSVPHWVTSDVVYIRFHGPAGLYRGEYPLNQLALWAERIKTLKSKGFCVFAFFNNDAHGFAVKNALQLKGLIGPLGHDRVQAER
jgi:uncharacterized protein YecE (DUF72 family)